jgi:transcriptional regulator with XRE-family HTH domain
LAKKPKLDDIVLLRRAVGLALVSLRERRGLQQQDVAGQAETSRGHLSGLERGRGDPRLSMIWRLSEVLRVSPVVLIHEVLKHYRALKES